MAVDTPLRRSRSEPPRRPGRASGSSAGLSAALGRAGVYIVIGLLSLFCVVPFAWVLLASLDRHANLYAKPPALSADNFIRFFHDATTPRLLFNSLLISIGATLLTLLLSVFGG